LEAKKMKPGLIRLSISLVCLLALGGCGNNNAGDQVGPGAVIDTLPETRSYRDAMTHAEGVAVRWVEPGAGRQDSAEVLKAVEAAISSAAARLASVDYGSLSLPDFVTQTRALKLESSLFTGQGAEVDAYGEASAGDKTKGGWALYRWRGPEFAQRPDRPQVYRWIHVYALYSYDRKTVTRLLATIYGQAIE
jgi:hypothetical protein